MRLYTRYSISIGTPMKSSLDVTSQAMIEVALALSMAFFSLLILVLVTMKFPDPANHINKGLRDKKLSGLSISNELKIKNTATSSSLTSASKGNHEKKQYVFFYKSKFYDKDLNTYNVRSVNKNIELIVAVPEHLLLSEIIKLKKQINHPNASITNLTESWLKVMEKLP